MRRISPSRRGVAQRADNRLELACRPVAEEGERDMQVLAPDDADVGQLAALPALDPVEDLIGQAKRKEEPEPFIAAHATAGRHTPWS